MQRIIAILLFIAFLLSSPGLGLAGEEPETEDYTSVSKRLIEAKEKSLTKGKLTEDLKEEAIDFDGEEKLQSIVNRAEETGQKVWLVAQAQTWPVFIFGLVGGMFLFLIGTMIKANSFKRVGGVLLFFAIFQLLIINYAPELAEELVSWIGTFF